MKYQLIDPLTPEEYAALEADILKRGVLIPVEKDENGDILDGHNRQEIADRHGIPCPEVVRTFATEHEKREHVIKINLARRQTDPVRWGKAFLQLLEERRTSFGEKSTNEVQKNTDCVSNGDTEEALAKELGVPRRTAQNRVRVYRQYETLPPEEKAAVNRRDKTVNRAVKDVKNAEKRRHRAAQAKKGEKSKDAQRIILPGNFDPMLRRFSAESVDLIFTDPPYDEGSIPLYHRLAERAAHVLKPGGSLICYAGHYCLADIITGMTPHLRFWWTISLVHSGATRRLHGKCVFVGWKPLLWFVKGGRRDEEFIADLIRGEEPDKEDHDWQQGESEAGYFIEHLTREGEMVLDPMCGSGTTCLAALRRNRRTIGIEIDEERANVAKGAVSALWNKH